MSIDLKSELLTRDLITQLYKVHGKNLISYARSLLNSLDDAQEVVHDLFCNLYDKVPKENMHISSVRAYLYVSVKNRSLNVIKKQKKIDALSDDYESSDSMTDSVDNSLSVHEIYKYINDQFPPDKREIFILRVIHGLVWREIADITGRSISSVHMAYNEGVDILRERFPDVF